MRRILIALPIAFFLVPVLRILPSEAATFSLSGGSTGIVGDWLSISLTTGLSPDTTLAYGMTYTQALGTEPLLSITRRSSLAGEWNLGLTASRGGLGGDYRVERLPEATVWRTAPLLGPFLSYTLEAGAANYIVRPVGLTGIRGTAAVTVSTAQIPLDPALGVSASAGYRQNVYSSGGSHSAWWASTQFSFTFSPSLSTSFTYFRQDPWSTSPLLFDTMGASNYLAGSASLTPAPGITIGHGQTYDFLAKTFSSRTFSVNLTLAPGVVGGLSWDDVGRQLAISLSTPEIGYVTMNLVLPTGRVSVSYTR
jgi:hypothetical protein